jgi:hypothetical protein
MVRLQPASFLELYWRVRISGIKFFLNWIAWKWHWRHNKICIRHGVWLVYRQDYGTHGRTRFHCTECNTAAADIAYKKATTRIEKINRILRRYKKQ